MNARCTEIFLEYAQMLIDYERTHSPPIKDQRIALIRSLPLTCPLETGRKTICQHIVNQHMLTSDPACVIASHLYCPKAYHLN